METGSFAIITFCVLSLLVVFLSPRFYYAWFFLLSRGKKVFCTILCPYSFPSCLLDWYVLLAMFKLFFFLLFFPGVLRKEEGLWRDAEVL